MWELAEYGKRAVDTPGYPGLRFQDINRNGTGMGAVWLIFVIEWGVFMVLAWYLEQVLSSGTGIRKHWLFPLQYTASPASVNHALRLHALRLTHTSC